MLRSAGPLKSQRDLTVERDEVAARISKLEAVVKNPAQFERKFKATMSATRLSGSTEGAAMLEAIRKSAELVAKDL